MSLHLDPYEYAKHIKHHDDEMDARCVLCVSENVFDTPQDKTKIADAVLANLENTYADIKALFGEQPELDNVIEKLYAEAEEL